MKKSEIRKLVAKHREIKNKLKKVQNKKLEQDLKEIEHRYFHETGRSLEFNIKLIQKK